MTRICILGLGYIGLPTASMFAVAGKTVIGVDPSPRVRAALESGRLPIEEPELETLVTAALQSGHLQVRDRARARRRVHHRRADAARRGRPTGRPELRRAAPRATSSRYLRRGNLVVLESTVPPGTTRDMLAPILAESGLVPGRDLCVAHCPERVLPGRILLELVQQRPPGRWTDARVRRTRGDAVRRVRQRRDHAHRRHHGRDGQGDGKHLPRRQRRAGQRVRADRRARRHRRLGGDPAGEPSPARERAAPWPWRGRPLHRRRSVVPG